MKRQTPAEDLLSVAVRVITIIVAVVPAVYVLLYIPSPKPFIEELKRLIISILILLLPTGSIAIIAVYILLRGIQEPGLICRTKPKTKTGIGFL